MPLEPRTGPDPQPRRRAGALIAFAHRDHLDPGRDLVAAFLLPVQVSILNVGNPSLSPTNLLYNVLATPGGLARFAQEGRLRTPLTRALLTGSVPRDSAALPAATRARASNPASLSARCERCSASRAS
jgi:hypothetical protein